MWLWGLPFLCLAIVEVVLFPLGAFRHVAARHYITEEVWLGLAGFAAQFETARVHPLARRPVLVVGSSVVNIGVDADQLAARLEADGGERIPVRVFAAPGARVIDEFLLAQLMPDPPPRLLLWNVHPSDFQFEGQAIADTAVARMLAHGGVQWPTGFTLGFGRRLQLTVGQYWRTYRYRILLQRMVEAELGRRLGLLALPGPWRGGPFFRWDLDAPENWQTVALRDVVAWCQERDVQLVIFSAPLCPGCSDKPPWTVADTDAFRAWMVAFTDRAGVPYLDYMDMPISHFDFNHVDFAGRVVLTDRLAADLRPILSELGSAARHD